MEILVTNETHVKYAEVICKTIEDSAKVRGTGIAKRTPEYITEKIIKSNGVIALEKGKFAGFCYIEAWQDKKFVANSGLIVHPEFRGRGLAKDIKKKILQYSVQKFPNSKVFGITTGLAVMKINYELGYQPVTFSELTDDDAFWKGCQACKNYDILMRNDRKMCLCTGMLYQPQVKQSINKKAIEKIKKITAALRLKTVK
ncbi:MAG: GNAT family N-acetyltransferase [Flavobacteriaceae bacterium]|nr:GNAT family N-acetyltransferase [Flavobacteriaceae bacterium]